MQGGFTRLFGDPNPIIVLQDTSVGLLDFKVFEIALKICFSSWPSISEKFQPYDSNLFL